MPVPTATCGVCGEVVNKRQTISVEPFGRVCRKHPEAEAHKEKMREMAQKAKQDEAYKKAMDNLNAITIASYIRVQAHLRGVGLGLAQMALCHNLSPELKKKVAEILERDGEMTSEEMVASLATYAALPK